MRKLFIYGHPGLYGGANTELHHQIKIWSQIEDLELHIIPCMGGFRNEPLYLEMIRSKVIYHEPHDFSVIEPEDAIINFCGSDFLDRIDLITARTKKTIFVNCMTWIHRNPKKESNELTAHQQKKIGFSLYQRSEVMHAHKSVLKNEGSNAQFLTFVPYFDPTGWEFSCIEQDKFHMGHISRADLDKFTKDILGIYQNVLSYRWKQGHFLGFSDKIKEFIGEPYDWIKTYTDQRMLPVKDFYKQVDIILQPAQTNENWPRIGFEAMFTGTPLVVDNRGGWTSMVEHGKTGFLCQTSKDFSYYASKLAYEFNLRQDLAHAALEKAQKLAGKEVSQASWEEIFEEVYR